MLEGEVVTVEEAEQRTNASVSELTAAIVFERQEKTAELSQTISAKDADIADLRRQIAELTHHTLIGTSNPQKPEVQGLPVQADRIFIPAGSRPGTISLAGAPSEAMRIISSKERGQWFEDLCKWVRTQVTGPIRVVKGIHEPENDIASGRMSLAQYLSWCDEDDAWTKEAGFISVQCLMGMTGKDTSWQQYWQESSDELWFDVYHGGPGEAPKAYNAPEKWLAPWFGVQKQIGKKIGFAEFASAPMATDTNDAGLLKWMRENANYCRAQTELVAASWYNSSKGPGRLSTHERAEAWLVP